MNFSMIEAFLTIVDTRSISRAAERLYLSQSTVSHRLKQLESELGCELIDRGQGQRASLLTERGEDFLPIARRWMILTHDVDTFRAGAPTPSLSVGSNDSLNQFLFYKLYNRILESGAPVRLNLRTHATTALYSLMSNNMLDIAFSVEHIRHKSIRTTLLFLERMVLVCRKGQYPAGPVHPSLLDPADELSIDWEINEMQLWHDQWWVKDSVPFVEINAPSFATSFLRRERCWMVVPISAARHYAPMEGLEQHELLEPPPRRACYKLLPREPRAGHAQALAAFEKSLSEFLSEQDWIECE